MPYNPQIHHRRSVRLQGYDYSQAGLYFITICCHNRECLFGDITEGEMVLNDAGKIAVECWMEIPKHFPNAVLHEHIIMPNHIHGVIELVDDNNIGTENVGAENVGAENVGAENVGAENVGAENFLPQQNDMGITVGVENFQPQQENFEPQHPKQNAFQKMIPRSIGSIVKGFKIGVTKWFRNNTVGAENILPIQTVWQRNYHEHIIRNEKSYQTISKYIMNNPGNWKDDKFYNQ